MLMFKLYRDEAGEWRWHLKSTGNGKIVADSGEGYSRRADAVRAIENFRAQVVAAPIARPNVARRPQRNIAPLREALASAIAEQRLRYRF